MKKMSIFQNKRRLFTLSTIVVLVALLFVTFGKISAASIPLTSIVSVNPGVSVTVSGKNFTPGVTFTARMGAYGTYGVGGTVVGSIAIDSTGKFTATYAIPSGFTSADKLAIRFDGTNGYFAYDWFTNVASGTSATSAATSVAPSGYTGYPTIDIAAVSAGSSVTILTHNMPAGQAFTVRINNYGTLGVGGTVVGTTSTAGGSFSQTFAIPSSLASQSKLAIRIDSPTGYYYAYDWFVNQTSGTSATSTPAATATAGPTPTTGPTATTGQTATPGPTSTPVPYYSGYPTMSIASVVKDSSVTLNAYNFPVNQTLNVRMNYFGTLGASGTIVTTVNSGSTGSFSGTYTIPASLVGQVKIAIRIETANGYYYAYNWFWNN